jgi:ABC-2 type transport system ATP-binding protein
MEVIRIERLCKQYGRARVLHDVSMTVRAGSLFGFLGPNGAGKSTTIRILLGLLRATSGHATVLGHDVWRGGPALRARVGYLPGDVRFYDHLTGRATLDFLNAARGGGAEREVTRLAERFDLDLSKRVRRYSRGMKQKLGLIQALMHRPELLILDEPTTALDPLVRQTLFEELRAVAAEGRTVLFSSHTLSEVEELCDEVAIVRRGRLIENDRIEVLRNRAVRRVEVFLNAGAPPPPPPPGLRISHRQNGVLEGAWVGHIDPLLAWLRDAAVADVVIAPPDLEDLFLAYYGDEQVAVNP